MTVDEPVPLRRAALGCLLIALLGFGAVLLVRPIILTFVPQRDDASAMVAQLDQLADGPVVHEISLSRPYGWDGERSVGSRSLLTLIVAPQRPSGASVVSAYGPLADCRLEIRADRLEDCDGNAWTIDGLPLDSEDPPLDRFPASVQDGAVVADLTRTVSE